jgi:DNA-directed RNA polymerase subunit M/transcription elongation factor TFIIS
MAEAESVKIICPKCDALIATIPKDRPLNPDGLICSNCGAELRTTPSPLEQVADMAKESLKKVEDVVEETLRQSSDKPK